MRGVLIISLALLATSASAAPALEIARESRIILRSGSWTPTQRETDAAYKCVQGFLLHAVARDRSVREILTHGREYRVQFMGIHRNGRKVIYCNFFPARSPEDRTEPYPQFERELVEVMDGGPRYWHIDYDPSIDRCSNFLPNGYA